MAAKFGKVSNSKLVLLGDSAVGKSSVVERFVKNEFFQYQVRVPENRRVVSMLGAGVPVCRARVLWPCSASHSRIIRPQHVLYFPPSLLLHFAHSHRQDFVRDFEFFIYEFNARPQNTRRIRRSERHF
jgi:GTPase SAR1 family protein